MTTYRNIVRVDEDEEGHVAIAFTVNAWDVPSEDLLIKEWGSVIGQMVKALAKTMEEAGINAELTEMKILTAVNESLCSIEEPPLTPRDTFPGGEEE